MIKHMERDMDWTGRNGVLGRASSACCFDLRLGTERASACLALLAILIDTRNGHQVVSFVLSAVRQTAEFGEYGMMRGRDRWQWISVSKF